MTITKTAVTQRPLKSGQHPKCNATSRTNVGKFACDIPATVTQHGQVSRYGFERGFTQTVRQGCDYLVIRMNEARDQFQVEGMVDGVQVAVYGLTALCKARKYVCEQFGQGVTQP